MSLYQVDFEVLDDLNKRIHLGCLVVQAIDYLEAREKAKVRISRMNYKYSINSVIEGDSDGVVIWTETKYQNPYDTFDTVED